VRNLISLGESRTPGRGHLEDVGRVPGREKSFILDHALILRVDLNDAGGANVGLTDKVR